MADSNNIRQDPNQVGRAQLLPKQSTNQREFIIHVPKNTGEKRFSICKFNDSLNVDPINWGNAEVRMSREENRKEVMAGVTEQDYGEGTVYGRAAREEARRKKYGLRQREYEHDAQPWRLSVNGRQFRSIQEGGAGEYADYWVFLKSGDGFQAQKITDWHKFMPCITHKTLDVDQAEEKFQLRNKVMNQFALKAQIMNELRDKDVVGPGANGPARSALKIKDEGSSDDDEDEQADEEDEEGKGKRRKKNGKNTADQQRRKDKRQRVENADEVAAYESEDGEDEGREYDYISDSGSDTEPDEKTAEEKVDEALVGVGDEAGLKSLIDDSDLSGTDAEDEDEEVEEKVTEKVSGRKKKATTASGQNEIEGEKESSESDSDDMDTENLDSVLFMQRKDVRKRPTTPNEGALQPSGSDLVGGIGSLSGTSTSEISTGSDAKRPKLDERSNIATISAATPVGGPDALNEDVVRALLQREPHTTKELLDKVKPRCGSMSKTEIVAKLAVILKKIDPYQFRQKVDKKEVLYFSLTQSS